MKSTILSVVLLFLLALSVFSGERIFQKEYEFRGRKANLEVEPGPFGSDVFLVTESRRNLSRNTPGENLFPKMFIHGDEYSVTWINYRKNDVKLNFYDSADESGHIAVSGNFSFISSETSVVYDRGRPRMIVFRGIKNSDNEDLFVHDVISGDTVRVAMTPGNEKSIKVSVDDLKGDCSFTIMTRTLNREYLYRVDAETLSAERVEEKIIVRGPAEAVTPFSAAELNTIIGFGDSITWGKMRMYDLADLYNPDLTYWAKTSEYFNRNYGTTHTINLGINRDSSYNGVERMDSDLSFGKGYFFLVLFGTNDVTNGSFSNVSTTDNLKWIMDNARNNYGMFPVISTVPPQKLYLEGIQFYRDQTESLNMHIISMAVENNFPYIDTYSAFFAHPSGWEAMLEDIKGNHPSPTGHQVMADMIIPILLELTPEMPSNVNYSAGQGMNAFSVRCDMNLEFDFSHYNVQFGFSPSTMIREMQASSNNFHVFFYPFNISLNRTVYFRLQSVDKDGNASAFSQIFTVNLN